MYKVYNNKKNEDVGQVVAHTYSPACQVTCHVTYHVSHGQVIPL